MYIPIMKNRDEELRVLRDMNRCFNESLMPLIEVYRDIYETRYQTDPVTGEYIYEKKPGNKKRNKIKLAPTEKDIITLNFISETLKTKRAFVDFFRFVEEEYHQTKLKGVELSILLSRDFPYYKKRIFELEKYKNLIPVISIKNGLEISHHNLISLISELKKKRGKPIALRITDDLFEDYSELIEDYLTDDDFIMLDIRNKHVASKFMEIEELEDIDTEAKKILLNSPRSTSHKNGDFENLSFTMKIDNAVATKYKDHDLDGFGDFGGLKDSLPTDSGSNGTGAALGLLYLKDRNSFFSIVNGNTKDGVKGYRYVRAEILKNLTFLDKDNDCIAIDRIKNMSGKFGTWSTWNNLTLTRYIQQQAEK